MDASTRFYNVYGKTKSGASALSSTRGALSSSARQLLILIDGQRSLGDLTSIFGGEALDRSLALLKTEGYVEIVRHFPETEDSPAVDGGALTVEEAPAEPTNAAPRRRSTVPVVLAAHCHHGHHLAVCARGRRNAEPESVDRTGGLDVGPAAAAKPCNSVPQAS